MGFSRASGTAYGLSVPCKDCERREVGCHSKCSDYTAYLEKLNAVKELVNKDRELMNLMSDKYRGRHKPKPTNSIRGRRK